MKQSFLSIALGVLLLGPLSAVAQLTGSVGPITSTAAKRAKKVCNVLDYGAKADKRTDIGPALTRAWAACASGGIGECLDCSQHPSSDVVDTDSLQSCHSLWVLRDGHVGNVEPRQWGWRPA
jgi:hypothetical protein